MMKYASGLLFIVAPLIVLAPPDPVSGEPLSTSQESAKPYSLGFLPYAMFSDDNDFGYLALDLGFPVDGELDGPGLKICLGLDWLF